MFFNAFGKALLGRVRFGVHGPVASTHGGERVLDLTQSKRDGEAIVDAIRREQHDHKDVIDAFHRMWYASHQTHGFTFYEGIPILKNPLDLWVYQEIMWDLRPTLLIETGTAFGGSALYYARQFDRIGAGKVITIDVEPADRTPVHPRITYIRGSSTDKAIVDGVRAIASKHPRVMVSLDSDHSMAHVFDELQAYASMVSPLQFLVVEDTNINGRPVEVDWHGGPGPGPAVDAWLPDHSEFERGAMAERYLMTFHSWLRKNK